MITITSQKIMKEMNCKPNKIWVDEGIAFYNWSMKSLLKYENIEI